MYTSIVPEPKINENSLDTLHNQSPSVHNRSRIMNKNDSDFVINTVICEAVGCFEEARVQIGVKAGQLGTITLSLCKNCVSKFVGED
jgi:hypothetical protein